MSTAVTPTRPVVGTFDDIGYGERAVRDLLAAGFDRSAVSMGVEDVEHTVEEAPPAPPSLALPLAFVTSLLCGAGAAVLAAFFAPQTWMLRGFDWVVSPVLLMALVGGAGGWMLGGIAGFGLTRRDAEVEAVPASPSPRRPVVTVTVRSPGRPEEARTILNATGARDISGGDLVYPDAAASRLARQRRAPIQQRGGQAARLSGAPAQAQGVSRSVPARAGLVVGLAVAAGAVLALFRRRRD